MIVSDKIIGGDYKLADYYSAFAITNHVRIDLREILEFSDLESIRRMYTITPEMVERVCNDLLATFPYKENISSR
jgi:hypothetical protein